MPADRSTLPKVLVTDVIRSAHQGQSHGGVHLVDLATGDVTGVLDWNDDRIDWEGRGGDRGLRGIAFRGDEIVIAASNEIFVFDRGFRVLTSFRNRYLSHCHEIALDGDTLYATSTRFNSVLALDLAKGAFTDGWVVRDANLKSRDEGGREVVTRAIVGMHYDPNGTPAVEPRDVHHINSVWREGGVTYICGTRLRVLLRGPGEDIKGPLRAVAPVPEWTHNCRPFREGVLYNSTQGDAIVFADRSGAARATLPIPQASPGELDNAGLPKDFARPGFGRGLAVTNDSVVIGGASPSTITAYDLLNRRAIAQVRLTKDVRNTPHGLEVWPYG